MSREMSGDVDGDDEDERVFFGRAVKATTAMRVTQAGNARKRRSAVRPGRLYGAVNLIKSNVRTRQ